MLDRELEKTLNRLFAEAREQRYEYMTIEHFLFALLNKFGDITDFLTEVESQ